MGLTKSDNYTEEQNQLAAILKALAHPARLAIIMELLERNSCICGHFVDKTGLAQPTVHRHLKELKAAGIIQGNVEGNNICYCINGEKWKQLHEQVNTLFRAYNTNSSCC